MGLGDVTLTSAGVGWKGWSHLGEINVTGTIDRSIESNLILRDEA